MSAILAVALFLLFLSHLKLRDRVDLLEGKNLASKLSESKPETVKVDYQTIQPHAQSLSVIPRPPQEYSPTA